MLPETITRPPVLTGGLRQRLQSGVGWSLASAVAGQGSTFLTNILIARILGRAIYGEYAMVVSTVLQASLFAALATGIASTKYAAEFRSTDPERAGRILGLCTLVALAGASAMAAGMALSSHWIASNVWHAPHLESALLLGALFLAISSYNGVQMGVLAGLEHYKALWWANLMGAVVTVAMGSLCAWLWGVNGAIAGLVGSGVVRCLGFAYFERRAIAAFGIRLQFRGFRSESHAVTKFAIPAALSGFSLALSPWLAQTFLVWQPGGFYQLGLFSAALNFSTIILFVPRIVDRVAFTLINHQKGAGDAAGYRKAFFANLGMVFALVCAGSVVMIVFGPYLLRLFGKSFQTAGRELFVLLALAAVADTLYIALNQIQQSNEKMWSVLLAAGVPRDVIYPLSAYLLAGHGVMGLALALVLSRWAALLGSTLLVVRDGIGMGRPSKVIAV